MTGRLNPKLTRVAPAVAVSARARRRLATRHYKHAPLPPAGMRAITRAGAYLIVAGWSGGIDQPRTPHQRRCRTGMPNHFKHWLISHSNRLVRDELARKARREARRAAV